MLILGQLGNKCMCLLDISIIFFHGIIGLHPMLDVSPRWGWVLCLGSFWGLFLLGVIGGVIGG
jgi:hypothetical protein